VVIDTTSRAVEGEENDANTIRGFYRHTGIKLKAAGIGWARLDHAGKDVERGQRGSSAKNDDVDVVWKLSRIEGGHQLEATHRRMSWVPEKVLVSTREDEHGVTRFALTNGGSWPEGTAALAAEMDALGVSIDLGEKRVRRDYPTLTGENRKLRAAIKYRRMRHFDGVGDVLKGAEGVRRKMSGAPVSGDVPAQSSAHAENPQETRAAHLPAQSAHPLADTRLPSAPRSGAQEPSPESDDDESNSSSPSLTPHLDELL
jgi:hypothetical protein